MTTLQCAITNKRIEVGENADGTPKLPPRWKRFSGQAYSPEAIKAHFASRAVRLPIASVTMDPGKGNTPDWSNETCKAAWQAWHQAFRISSREARLVYNYAMVELAKGDNAPLQTTAKGHKLPPMEETRHMYGGARLLTETLDSQSTGSILQKARAKYKDSRFDRRIVGKSTLPEAKNDLPVPIPSQCYTVTVTEHNEPLVRVRVGGQRFLLRLRNTPERKHHTTYWAIAQLKKALAGEARLGEVSIYQKKTSYGDHRNGGETRVGQNGHKRKTRYFCAFSMLLRKDLSERTQNTMVVRLCKDKFLGVWINDRKQPWNLHDEQVRKWVAAHRFRLHRLSEDAKMERRHPKKQRTRIADIRATAIDRHHKRLADHAHKVSRMIANLAARHKVGTVVYHDDEAEFCLSYPYFKLRKMVADKLHEKGISFEYVKPSDDSDSN